MRLLVLSLALLLTVAAGTASGGHRVAPLSIFVIAGQSNAAGYGQPLPTTQATNPRVFDLTHGYKRAVQPLGDAPGYGFGVPFGAELAKHGMRVGLVNCAVGGSSLETWLPGGVYYAACVALVQQAERYGAVRGVLFFQGETDGLQQDWASTWAPRFGQFVTAIRADVGNVPVVFGRILDFDQDGLPYSSVVRAQQRSVRLPKVAMVNADDLPHVGEHFTPAGYDVLGRRLATSWLQIRR